MELFEQLRREYEFGVGTIKGVARKFGVHRRLVRQAVNSALPPVRTYRQRSKPVLGAVEGFIDGILEADRQAPRKQRHTARRIYHRILAEMPGHPVAESTVRNYVHDRKRALGLLIQEIYVAQSYSWGGEAQVDWYEAYADLGGDLTKLQVFCMRSMASGGAFHRAYLSATQQAFLEGHELAFRHFGGVFRLLRYDNLTSAVRKVLRGRLREETERFIALRSHWHFEAEGIRRRAAAEQSSHRLDALLNGTTMRHASRRSRSARRLHDGAATLLHPCLVAPDMGVGSTTMDAVAGGGSVARASGSAFSGRRQPSGPTMANLYRAPAARRGMNSSAVRRTDSGVASRCAEGPRY